MPDTTPPQETVEQRAQRLGLVPPNETVEQRAQRLGLTQAAPEPKGPGVFARAGEGVLNAVRQAVTHPIDTAENLITAPIRSAMTALAPGAEEVNAKPGSIAYGSMYSRVSPPDGTGADLALAKQHVVTPGERTAATAQTVATLAAPEIAGAVGRGAVRLGASKAIGGLAGLGTAGGTVGAAYTPDDPAAGFLTGAVLAPVLKKTVDAVPAAASFVRNIPPGAVRDVALAAVPGRMATALRGLVAATKTPLAQATEEPPVEGLEPVGAGVGGERPIGALRSLRKAPSPVFEGDVTPLNAAGSETASPVDSREDLLRQALLKMGIDPETAAKAKVWTGAKPTPLSAVQTARPDVTATPASPIAQATPLETALSNRTEAELALREAKNAIQAAGPSEADVIGALSRSLKSPPKTPTRFGTPRGPAPPVVPAEAPDIAQDMAYQTGHAPTSPDFAAPFHDLTKGGQVYPEDVYSAQGARIYGGGPSQSAMDQKVLQLARQARGNPATPITVYRAVPSDLPAEAQINPGDWVAVSKKYAEGHGEGPLNGAYRILSKKVPAGEIFNDGDSLQEYSWWPKVP